MSAWATEPKNCFIGDSKPTLTIYFIEANIGAGKSDLLKGLESYGYTCIPEPLKEWQKEYVSENGDNILDTFYKNPKETAFQFQMIVIMTRYRLIMKSIKEAELIAQKTKESQILFMERSLFTDRNCFSQLLYESGKISKLNWKIYTEWHNFFLSHVTNSFFERLQSPTKVFSKIDTKYVYLNTRPEVCYARIKKRARKEEDHVPLEYIKVLGDKHNEWLINNSIEIDGNKSHSEVIEQLLSCI